MRKQKCGPGASGGQGEAGGVAMGCVVRQAGWVPVQRHGLVRRPRGNRHLLGLDSVLAVLALAAKVLDVLRAAAVAAQVERLHSGQVARQSGRHHVPGLLHVDVFDHR